MIKNLSTIEIQVGEKIYRFICDADCNIGEVHDVLNQMKALVINKMNDLHALAQAPKDPPPTPTEQT